MANSTRVDVRALGQGASLPQMIVEVNYSMVLEGAIASRDWQPIHHNRDYARGEAGLPDIIMNNYAQAGWVSKYITDWSGPFGRIAKLKLAMRKPICPGYCVSFDGVVTSVAVLDVLATIDIDINLRREADVLSVASARVVLPLQDSEANPWRLTRKDWASLVT